jgi:hypothetical protein
MIHVFQELYELTLLIFEGPVYRVGDNTRHQNQKYIKEIRNDKLNQLSCLLCHQILNLLLQVRIEGFVDALILVAKYLYAFGVAVEESPEKLLQKPDHRGLFGVVLCQIVQLETRCHRGVLVTITDIVELNPLKLGLQVIVQIILFDLDIGRDGHVHVDLKSFDLNDCLAVLHGLVDVHHEVTVSPRVLHDVEVEAGFDQNGHQENS